MFHQQKGQEMRKFLLLLAILASIFSTTVPTAMASGTDHEICTNEGSPTTCANAWNGGPSWAAYTPGVLNDAVIVEGVNRCNNGNYTTPNCPVAGVPGGLFMYQIVDNSISSKYEGQCMAAAPGGFATMGACNNPNWNGAVGTVQITDHAGCASGYNHGVNAYWTGQNGGWSNRVGIGWTPVVGQTVYTSVQNMDCIDYVSF